MININVPIATLKYVLRVLRGEEDIKILTVLMHLGHLKTLVEDLWREWESEDTPDAPLVYHGQSYDLNAWYKDDLLDDLMSCTPNCEMGELADRLSNLCDQAIADEQAGAGPRGVYAVPKIDPTTILLIVQVISTLGKLLWKKKAA